MQSVRQTSDHSTSKGCHLDEMRAFIALQRLKLAVHSDNKNSGYFHCYLTGIKFKTKSVCTQCVSHHTPTVTLHTGYSV